MNFSFSSSNSLHGVTEFSASNRFVTESRSVFVLPWEPEQLIVVPFGPPFCTGDGYDL